MYTDVYTYMCAHENIDIRGFNRRGTIQRATVRAKLTRVGLGQVYPSSTLCHPRRTPRRRRRTKTQRRRRGQRKNYPFDNLLLSLQKVKKY